MEQSPASEHAVTAAENKGLDLSAHKSQTVKDDAIRSADIILTMTKSHKSYLLSAYPQFNDKIFTIHEYSIGTNEDVADPFGGSIEVYEECFGELFGLIGELIIKLKNKGAV